MFDYNKNGLIAGVQNIDKPRIVNYHCHSIFSNPSTPDCAVKPMEYVNRAKEVGNTTLCTTEHGSNLGYWEYYFLSKKHDLKYVYSTEAYFVIDKFTKDSTNAHIIVIAKNESGRKQMNLMLSNANIDGYYYKARTDLKDLLSLNPKDFLITTACLGGLWKYDNYMPYKNEYQELQDIEAKLENFKGMSKEEYEAVSLLLGDTANIDELMVRAEELRAIEDIDKKFSAEDILVKLHNHFGSSLYLEVQCHNSPEQIALNREIVELSNKYGIEMIAGQDSHFIYPQDKIHRDAFLYSKGISYEDEGGWYTDYADYETFVERFIEQGVLTESQILRAIDNTLIIETFDDIEFNDDIKLPTIHMDKTLDEKNQFLLDLLTTNLDDYLSKNPEFDREEYYREMMLEYNDIADTGMADYFLLNYEVIKRGREKYNGVLTYTGRGSGAGFLCNMLLGFTTVDRLQANVPMLASRFISKSRILETRSLPDIDFNTSKYLPFKLAQDELLGETGNYFMITFGKFHEKAAWKCYARANDVDFEVANAISKQIGEYELAKKHADEDEEVSIYDYIGEEYQELYEKSAVYLNVIDNISPSPCSFLLLNQDIREEIGVTRIKNVLVANVTGAIADDMKFLKNDLLQVKTVDITDQVCKTIGIPQPTSQELIKMTKDRPDIWEKVYGEGYTVNINQCEQPASIRKVIKYKPGTIDELCHFVAAIRPSFQSMYSKFEGRESFAYGIPAFDKILQGRHSLDSFLIYQEQIMQALNYAGIEDGETYSIIKAISKKKEYIIKAAKEKFLEGFMKKAECDIHSAEKVWTIIENAAAYGFNSAHSYCVALDSLYNAWLKVDYPYEFYETCLALYSGELDPDVKKDSGKIAGLIKEMDTAFGIKFGELKWGNDNTSFRANKETGEIYPSLMSVKYMNKDVASILFELSKTFKPANFAELYLKISETPGVNSRHVKTLVTIGYFKDFGSRKKLLKFIELAEGKFSKKTYNKEKADAGVLAIVKMFAKDGHEDSKKTYRNVDMTRLLSFVIDKLPEEDFALLEAFQLEWDLTGNIFTEIPKGYSVGIVSAKSYSKPWMLFKSLKNNSETWIQTRVPATKIPKKESVIMLYNVEATENRRAKRIDYSADFEIIKEK